MNPNRFSLAQIRALLPAEKNRFDALWVHFFLRPLSFPVAWVFLRLGFSANQVSYLSVLVSLLAASLMFTGKQAIVVAGAVMFNFWAVLDCVDGNVARVRRQTSKYGAFADAVGGYVTFAFVLLGAGVAAESGRAYIPEILSGVNFIFLGALASICNLTMRLIYQHFINVSGERVMGSGSYQRTLDSNLGITGLLMPAILVGALFNVLHYVVAFYAVFYALAFVLITTVLVRKGARQAKLDRRDDLL